MKGLDFENSIGVIIKTASSVLERALEQKMAKDHGLTGGKWKVIVGLTVKDGINQKELAEMIFLEPPTLVPIIDRMEKDGWVQRTPDPEDRRSNRVFLTKKSKQIVEPIVEGIVELRKSISKDISKEDMETTKNVLKKITKNASSYYNSLKSAA